MMACYIPIIIPWRDLSCKDSNVSQLAVSVADGFAGVLPLAAPQTCPCCSAWCLCEVVCPIQIAKASKTMLVLFKKDVCVCVYVSVDSESDSPDDLHVCHGIST